jgi:hypothetical protein
MERPCIVHGYHPLAQDAEISSANPHHFRSELIVSVALASEVPFLVRMCGGKILVEKPGGIRQLRHEHQS